MNLASNGNIAKLWRFTYGDRRKNWQNWDRSASYGLPRSFCRMFWGLVFAVPFFLVSWLSFPFKARHLIERILCTILSVLTISLASGVAAGSYIHPHQALKIVGWALTIVGSTAAVVGLLVFLIEGGYIEDAFAWTINTVPKAVPRRLPEPVRVAIEAEKAFKEKYCPIVDWK